MSPSRSFSRGARPPRTCRCYGTQHNYQINRARQVREAWVVEIISDSSLVQSTKIPSINLIQNKLEHKTSHVPQNSLIPSKFQNIFWYFKFTSTSPLKQFQTKIKRDKSLHVFLRFIGFTKISNNFKFTSTFALKRFQIEIK